MPWKGSRVISMQINMTTFGGRKIHYVQHTIDSLLDSEWIDTKDKLNLIVGSPDEAYLEDFVGHPSINIVHWDVETNPNMRWNCTLNKIRALRYGDDREMLICEDDIKFPHSWLSELREIITDIDVKDYVLSLCVEERALQKARFVPGKKWIKRYPFPALQGAQALYYPSKDLRTKVAYYLKDHMTKACGDELIGRYALIKAALYASDHQLVENIGAVSCFEEDV
jgi:hypothetical protein